MAKQAADCAELLSTLGAKPAHIVGHSSGAIIALQLALDSPEAVRSLTLLEPPLFAVPSRDQLFERIGPTPQMFEDGDSAGAFDSFMKGVCGERYRAAMEKALPGTIEQAIADAATFFSGEFQASGEWTFGREDAARIRQPVLTVVGAESGTVWPGWDEGQKLLLEWFPKAKPFVLPHAAHLLQVENPRDMAEGLAAFLASA
jgi:pimeloyl-ACP methyl ester carboxylesterase